MSNPLVLLETSMGDILVELLADKAPQTVANFLAYVDAGHYAYTIFHRVIKDFMIQGGGLTMQLKDKPVNAPVDNEAANGLKNLAGTVAMARAADPHSATCQFFINVVDNPDLDYAEATKEGFGYCVFGQVMDGMDVVQKISKVRTKAQGAHANVPIDPVSIISASRFEM